MRRRKIPVQRRQIQRDANVCETNIQSDGNVGPDVEEVVESRASVESDGSVGLDGDEITAVENEGDDFVEVEICDNLEEHFGNVANEDGAGSGEDDVDDDDNGDDIWNDDTIPDPFSDDDEAADAPAGNRVRADEVLALGMTFSSADDFKNALLRYSLKTQYDIKMYKSSVDRLGARCTEDKCGWRVYCSFERRRKKLMIKVYIDEHICVRSGYTKLLKSGTIAHLFEERLRLNPKIKSQEMVDEIKREYNMIVSVHQCRRAKKTLSDKRKASHEAHFARIWDYQAEIISSNPQSTMEIETIPGPTPGSKQRFYRLYVCFDALKESWWSSCRPIIGLDAAFLKWDLKGQLLAAVGRDGDNRIFPIAWAVVEVEDIPNWLWFVQLMKKDLRLEDGTDITIISDKHQGLLNAVRNELPKAEHRMCARHILDNWRKKNKDIELERMFWRIARSYTTGEYADNLEIMKQYNQGAHDSLLRTSPTSWSRAFFKLGSCCNDNLNNLSESFNRSIREARRKPLLDMLEDIRRKCMVRNAKRSLISNKWNKPFTPRVHGEIEKNREKAKECIRHMSTGNEHEVDFHGESYRVKMGSHSCGCGYWQLNGIPCMHAMCVITSKRLIVDDYVSYYYKTAKWRHLYTDGIKPVQGMKLWPRLGRLPVLPPPDRFNRGRPNDYARRKGPHESASRPGTLTRNGHVMTCSNCLQEGHNKTRCGNPRATHPAKRPRGRPRKYQGASQAGASQAGASQARASQVGSSQVGSSQVGSSQVGSSQVGSSQAGSSFGFSS